MTDRGERRLGEVVGGKYKLCRFLASGGMGAVYEAQHTLVKRRFAVKFLHPDLVRKRDLLGRFQREAEAAGSLESENVAAAVDLGVAADGSPYIVMEYLSGESLERLLDREGTLPLTRAADLVQQACRGMQVAHGAGIVHRDLKPHNLFVCRREDGTDLLKVLDFGVAKLEAVEPNSAATRTGTVLGTPSYMAPEQARGEKNVGHAADVYALGAILYELLSAKKPHPGDSHNAILHHIATQPAVPLESVKEGLPEELVRVVTRALAPRPEDRYFSAGEFGAALALFARRTAWPAPELEPSSPLHAEPSSTELAPSGAAAAPSPREPSLPLAGLEQARERTHAVGPPLLFWVLAAAASVVALAVFFAERREPAETERAKAKSESPRALSTAAPIEPALVEPPPAPAPPAANVTAPQATVAAPLPEVAAPREIARAAPSRPNGQTPRMAPSPAAGVPAAGARPPQRETHELPADTAAAPVVFDQQNPYR